MRVEGLPFDSLDIVESSRMEEEFNLIHSVHYIRVLSNIDTT